MKSSEVIKEYIYYSDIQKYCTQIGDYKQGNVAASNLEGINDDLKTSMDKESVQYIIDSVLDSDNPNAIMWITPVCQCLQYRIPLIIEKLSAYSVDKELGILSLNALMLLKTVKPVQKR